MLTIVGGVFKGRKILAPKGNKTRPTSNMLRKAVFDICQNQIQASSFLDLFAGSGAMGFEALSRGAEHATFVDIDKSAIKAIKENSQLLKVEENAKIILGDVISILRRLSKNKRRFNIIYIDPPYPLASMLREILIFIDQNALFQPNTYLFVEEASPSTLMQNPLDLTFFSLQNSRAFGKSLLHQYRTI